MTINPCPFCNSSNVMVTEGAEEYFVSFYVFCGSCDARGPMSLSVIKGRAGIAKNDSIRKWNRKDVGRIST